MAALEEGQSLSEIGRALGKVPGSIHGVVASNGGYVPAQQTRAASALTLAEREEISRGLAADESFRTIAARLGRAPSTISREVRRHGGRRKYRAALLRPGLPQGSQQPWGRAEPVDVPGESGGAGEIGLTLAG
ncbi:helix-turn-helix domain-containing protein [Streptomyces sp. NPDC059101]|uniref:helix-turn-helix domain-containing protein n=1 Tax=Streptomyces sp. NPDC059101 TaxID=3346728 RepID=UPI0036A58D22